MICGLLTVAALLCQQPVESVIKFRLEDSSGYQLRPETLRVMTFIDDRNDRNTTSLIDKLTRAQSMITRQTGGRVMLLYLPLTDPAARQVMPRFMMSPDDDISAKNWEVRLVSRDDPLRAFFSRKTVRMKAKALVHFAQRYV